MTGYLKSDGFATFPVLLQRSQWICIFILDLLLLVCKHMHDCMLVAFKFFKCQNYLAWPLHQEPFRSTEFCSSFRHTAAISWGVVSQIRSTFAACRFDWICNAPCPLENFNFRANGHHCQPPLNTSPSLGAGAVQLPCSFFSWPKNSADPALGWGSPANGQLPRVDGSCSPHSCKRCIQHSAGARTEGYSRRATR